MEPTSLRIGIGIIREFQNMPIGIKKIFIRLEVFANNLQIPDICFFSHFFFKYFFIDSYIFFYLKNLPGKQSHTEICKYSLSIFNIRIRYLSIL